MTTNPQPIEQQIKVTADTGGVAETSQALEQLTAQNEQASQEDQLREQQILSMRIELKNLIREQREAERAVEAGEQATEETRRAEEQRRQKIRVLSQEIARAEDEQEQLNRRLDQGVAAHRRLGQANDGTTQGVSRLDDVVNAATGRLAGMVGGILGAGGLVRALQVLGEELDRRIEQTREFAEAQLNLQFLDTSFNEQEREFLGQAAQLGGRSPAEIARAYTSLRSRFPDRSNTELQGLFLEIVETGVTTDADLGTLTDAFAGLFAENGDSQRSQNILRETITQAGVGDPGVISRLLGKFLGPGQQIGNVSEAEAAGLVAGATGLDTRQPEEQITGLRSVLLSLLGSLSDEQLEIAQGAGIDRSSINTALLTLGQAIEAGRIDAAGLEQLVGAEGVTTATALGDPAKRGAFFEKQAAVVRAADSEEDLTGLAIDNIFAQDEVQALNFAIKQVDARTAVAESQDVDALRGELAIKLQQAEQRDAGVGAIGRSISGLTNRIARLLGADADTSITAGEVALDYTDAFGPALLGLSADQSDRYAGEQRAREQLQRVRETGRIDEPEIASPAQLNADAVEVLGEIRDELKNGSRGDITIHGDVYGDQDPALKGLGGAYGNAR
ncbi:hypothetical protein [Algisphaera agarilytica]|uniref:Uncharacterized protein n=1 Tax=Algisphaera agarilytica TaxID=1385975 RepID=A0A7X0H507_9BACT|nr:hypothetical protein [Algisphaera agarilytica]MBB6429223.1 hypothetical protein [Algisphaera agarilytica]